MKVTVNVECSPQEARAFFGLPDVTPINDLLVEEVRRRTQSNLELLDPSELMKNWTNMGGVWADQFFEVVRAAAGASVWSPASGAGAKGDDDG